MWKRVLNKLWQQNKECWKYKYKKLKWGYIVEMMQMFNQCDHPKLSLPCHIEVGRIGHAVCNYSWLKCNNWLVVLHGCFHFFTQCKPTTGCSLNIVFFSWKFCDFSELCQFCCSAGVLLPAWCVYAHWHREKTESGIF